jgi:hypothetical protein
MLPIVSFRVFVHLVLAICLGGLVPPSPPHLAAAAGNARLAPVSRGHVDMPALPRAHVRDGSRIDGARKAPQGSAAVPPRAATTIPVTTVPATRATRAVLPLSTVRPVHRLRGPPSLI